MDDYHKIQVFVAIKMMIQDGDETGQLELLA